MRGPGAFEHARVPLILRATVYTYITRHVAPHSARTRTSAPAGVCGKVVVAWCGWRAWQTGGGDEGGGGGDVGGGCTVCLVSDCDRM